MNPYQINLTKEQEAALARCDFSLQQAIDERLAPVIESMKSEKGASLLEAFTNSDQATKDSIAQILGVDPNSMV